jgi:hypothetical protein
VASFQKSEGVQVQGKPRRNLMHEVDTKPDKEEGIAIAVNSFYFPYYHRWFVDQNFLQLNDHYLAVNEGPDLVPRKGPVQTPAKKSEL